MSYLITICRSKQSKYAFAQKNCIPNVFFLLERSKVLIWLRRPYAGFKCGRCFKPFLLLKKIFLLTVSIYWEYKCFLFEFIHTHIDSNKKFHWWVSSTVRKILNYNYKTFYLTTISPENLFLWRRYDIYSLRLKIYIIYW